MSWLAITIGECADVDACEYVELPVGGIMWENPATTVPIDAGDEAELPDLPWAKAALSGGWWSVIYGYADPRSSTKTYGSCACRCDHAKAQTAAKLLPQNALADKRVSTCTRSLKRAS